MKYRDETAAVVQLAPEVAESWTVTESRVEEAAVDAPDLDHHRIVPVAARGAASIAELSLAGGSIRGRAIVGAADDPAFAGAIAAPAEALRRAALIVDLSDCGASAEERAALAYLALRRARILGRPTIVARALPNAPILGELDLQPIPHLVGNDGALVAAQRVDVAIDRAWARAGSLRPTLRRVFVDEAVETLERWIATFFETAWFNAIWDGTMTRPQYVATLSNMHQFVRLTTRLIGRAVGFADDRELRNHWLAHLEGEINHELILEKDLAELGADVGYVTERMVPSVENQAFMVLQESLIGFHQDPVLFMAAPFVAEGFSARLDRRFLAALERLVSGWGVPNPKRATLFFASHIEYDGGDDGHWAATRAILERYLEDDRMLQRFVNAARLAMAAFGRSYASYVDDLAIFEAPR